MQRCIECGGWVIKIDEDLSKCLLCGLYFRDAAKGILHKNTAVSNRVTVQRMAAEAGIIGSIEELPPDPEFLEFLNVASQYGAPKTLPEFLKLNPTDRAYYLKAYSSWLKQPEAKIYLEKKS